MHVEKNIAEFVLKFFFEEKNTPESWRDLQAMGMRRELWLRPGRSNITFTKPQAPYMLTEAEKKMFIEEVSAIRTPKRYESSFRKRLSKFRFMVLKSHDYHYLIQQIIPTVSRTLLQPL